jgi:hypothetical protein
MERKFVNVGDHVIFTDTRRKQHSALVTEVWDGGPEVEQVRESLPAINLLYVVDDETRMDQYGRQIERESSVVPVESNSAEANCYTLVNE